jgi:hypothetical protein
MVEIENGLTHKPERPDIPYESGRMILSPE